MKRPRNADPVKQFLMAQIDGFLRIEWSQDCWNELYKTPEKRWENFLSEHERFLSYFAFRLLSNRCDGTCRCEFGVTVGDKVGVLINKELSEISPERFASDKPALSREILTKIRNACLKGFIDKHSSLFYRKAVYLQDSKDTAHAVLQRFYAKDFVSYDPSRGTLRAFLLKCIGNEGLTELKGLKKQAARERPLVVQDDNDEIIVIELEDQGRSALERLIDEQNKECLEEAFLALKPRQRKALDLFHIEDLSFKEIGEQLGCTETYAKVLAFRGRQQLKKRLTELGWGRVPKNVTSDS